MPIRLFTWRSCISQLLCIVHDVNSSFDCNLTQEVRGTQNVRGTQEARGMFLDISKTFDRVWHEGLLFK